MALVIGAEQTLMQRTDSRAFVPLKDVRVDAKIVDVVAKMTVQQTYYNQEPNPIEVVYVFPLDAKAAVCQFSIRIDGHLVHGGSEERVAARDTYHAAISEGHGAFLLEQPMPDVFQISVGNLAPGEQANVTIAYLKLSDGNTDESEFPIPTWFSPRMRQSTPTISFLAVAERPDEDKPLGQLITRKVPMAPTPGDYFYFGATIGPKFGKTGTPAEEEEDEEQEEPEAVPAIMDRGLDLGLVAQERQQPEALQVVSRDGAKTSASLILTGGTGSVHAEASSESHAVLERVIAQAVTEAVAEVSGGGSAEATSKSLARAIGSATATAVADAVVTVNIDGQGEAHGIAEADATAIAKVVAQAIAKATAVAVGVRVYAKGVGRAQVSETRLAKAIAHASAEASTRGGEAEASSTVVADAVVDVVAEAMATALSSVADHVANAETKAEAMVDATDEQVFVDTADDAFVAGESKASGKGSGNASTSVLPDEPESKKSSTIPIRPQAESKSSPQKKTSTMSIRPTTTPVDSQSAAKPAAGRPSGKKTSTLPIGPQTSPAVAQGAAQPGSGRTSGKKTSSLPIGPQKTPEETSSFEFRPQPAGWPTRPPTTRFAEGKEQRPPTKYSSTLPIGPRPVGYPAKPDSTGNRPVMKNTSNVQIRPQGTEWPTGWSSHRPAEEGRFQSHRPSTTFKSSGQRPSSSHTGIRISTQSGPETKVIYTSTGGPGRTQFSGPGYTVTTSNSYFSRQRGGQLQSPRSLPEDPVAEILDLQEADGSFRLTEKLGDVLGVNAMNALMEYNVFRASLGESNLVDSAGAESWAIALVLEMFELKMMDRKSDWEQSAFKAADLLASVVGEDTFNAILSAARMYLIRLIKANEALWE